MDFMRLPLDKIESVYRRRGADFFRLALARTGDIEAAREAVQEGFAGAIRGRHTYRGDGSVEAWIARCVINAAQDLVQRVPAAVDEGGAVLPSENGREERLHSIEEVDDRIVREAVARTVLSAQT
jgi:DNA-directed RNA polymerase specialized sigma24 family protein